MDATTAKIIRKIRGLITTTDTDPDICDRIESAFDAIFADTGKAIRFRFTDEIEYPIFPTIADEIDTDGSILTGRGDLRELVIYRVLVGSSMKKQDDKTDGAVKVKSGRDSIDTVNAMSGAKDISNFYLREYQRLLNDVNENINVGGYYEQITPDMRIYR